jgi:hypothetical protein
MMITREHRLAIKNAGLWRKDGKGRDITLMANIPTLFL